MGTAPHAASELRTSIGKQRHPPVTAEPKSRKPLFDLPGEGCLARAGESADQDQSRGRVRHITTFASATRWRKLTDEDVVNTGNAALRRARPAKVVRSK